MHAAEGAADRNERACEAAFIARATSAVWMAVVRREVEREPNEGARERILRQWRRLYGNCGLKLKTPLPLINSNRARLRCGPCGRRAYDSVEGARV